MVREAAGDRGVSPRQASLVAGYGLLVMAAAAPFAELYVRPTLIVAGDVEQTVRNIVAREGLYLAGVFSYLLTFVLDVVVAWALYVLLAPVNRSLSLLVAWLRVVYAAIALSAVLKLVTVYRLVTAPEHLAILGAEQLQAQLHLLLSSWRYEWSMGMALFGIHLVLLGLLAYRSRSVPKLLGVLLVVAGSGYAVSSLRPYLYPDANLRLLTITFFGELVFMVWLLARGGKTAPAAAAPAVEERHRGARA